MAKIVVFTHALDKFFTRRWGWPPIISSYMLYAVLRELMRKGHRIQVVAGPKRVRGDVAFLHVDSTVIDPEYIELAEGFQHTVNFGAVDNSKRRVSKAILSKGDDWSGKVVVKSNLNFGGRIEVRHNEAALAKGLPPPHPGAEARTSYDILDHIHDVPAEVWDDSNLVVERFIPEIDEEGYAMRTWLFMGAHGTSFRHISKDPIIKSHTIFKSEPVEPPEEIRRERERLGFDYGKFDFVVHEGTPMLLDANRTPGMPAFSYDRVKRGGRMLAAGFEEMVFGKK